MADKIGQTDKRLSDTRAINSTPLRPACPGEPMGGRVMFMPLEDLPYRPASGPRKTGPGSESLANAVHVAKGCKGSCEY